jgi:predicted AAA+ superfamily ATPase
MEKIIGRKHEISLLEKAFYSKEAEFIALYGRRRVGKTFLISQFSKGKGLYFELTGQYAATQKMQLENFTTAVEKAFFEGVTIKAPTTWKEAFLILEKCIESNKKHKRIILFFDELPWLHTKRSKFVSYLEYFWNTYACKQPNIKLIVCGSAASWMLENIVYAKGGLHNRITTKIRLLPFSLAETKHYLKSRSVILSDRAILDAYMILGGIPHYLKQIDKNLSVMQNINNLCFKKDGLLADEFDLLFASLFNTPADYKKIVHTLAKSPSGLTVNELAKKAKIKISGSFHRRITNLEEAGFISSHTPFQGTTKGKIFRLCDAYSLFYLRWIYKLTKDILNDPTSQYWFSLSHSQAFKIWSGYAFEGICLNHAPAIKKALGISGIQSTVGFYRKQGTKTNPGVQIDLLIDRKDQAISICEIKCYNSKYVIDKKNYSALKTKIERFRQYSKTKKSLFLVMITPHGIHHNEYSQEIVSQDVTLSNLFRE